MKRFGAYRDIVERPVTVIVVGLVATIGFWIENYAQPDRSQAILYINMGCSIASLITLGIYLAKQFNAWQAISGYTIVFGINLVLVPFFDFGSPDFATYFLRNSFFFLVLIPSAGLIWGPRILIASSSIFLMQVALVVYLTRDPFLEGSLLTIALVLGVYTLLTYTILSDTEKHVEEQSDLIDELEHKTEALDKSNSTKSKLLSIISHDLRNPMMSMASLADFIHNESKETGSENLQEYTSLLIDTTTSTNSLIENLLEWSRTQTGSFNVHREKLDIRETAMDVLQLMEESVKAKKLSITIDPIEIEYVDADPNSLKLILRNLITNAIKYSNYGGAISISSEKGHKSTNILIKDRGVGMDKQTVRNLMDPDLFSSSTGTNQEKGSGLGFNLSLEHMQLHGGTIQVVSKQGEGTTMILHFPDQSMTVV